MIKQIATLVICSLLATSATISSQSASAILDGNGQLILLEAEDVGLQMSSQCKSFRVSKNPPLVPRLKCRFS